jgi:L-idonate 5-dehydrogenase
MTWEEAALVEPTAVAVHATQRSGQVLGTRALVIGAGPIGLLLIQVLRASGAAFIAVSDLLEDRCARAVKCGADKAFVAAGNDTKGMLQAEGCDVVFEMSGAPAAHALALEVIRRGGTVVQVGSLPAHAIDIPGAAIMTKELNVLGSFRFSRAFDTALNLAASGRIHLAALESRRFRLDQVAEALECAASGRALKVHISFGDASS